MTKITKFTNNQLKYYQILSEVRHVLVLQNLCVLFQVGNDQDYWSKKFFDSEFHILQMSFFDFPLVFLSGRKGKGPFTAEVYYWYYYYMVK